LDNETFPARTKSFSFVLEAGRKQKPDIHIAGQTTGLIVEVAFECGGESWRTSCVIGRWKRSADSVHGLWARAAMSGSKKPTFLQDWPMSKADQKAEKQATVKMSPQMRTDTNARNV
jgi:hypothetical protein